MILVDTSVWIDFFRGKDTSYAGILHDLIVNEADLCITGIILTEILQGIKDDKANKETKGYLLEFPLYDISGITTYVEAANIFRRCMRKGKTVRKTIDCLIAAVAIENDLILLHNDSDFDSIAQCTALRVMKP
jgi:predicted nucleic acid-binding protein